MYVSVGEKYGMLTVLEFIRPHYFKSSTTQYYVFKCECECGNMKETVDLYLHRGSTTSCGCNRVTRIPDYLKDCRNYEVDRKTVNQPYFIIYRRWLKKYGVCEEWRDYLVFKESLTRFKNKERLAKGVSIIDKTKPASPTNIRRGSSDIRKILIEEGKKVGHLTIIRETRKPTSNQRAVLCKCECGKEVVKYLYQIKTNRADASCGCVKPTWKTTKTMFKGDESSYSKEDLRNYWYGRWRLLLRSKDVCEEWKDYRVFKAFVDKLGIEIGVVFWNKDSTKPISPDNITLNKKMPMKIVKPRVEIGDRFGKYVVKVINFDKIEFERGSRIFDIVCQCDCGKFFTTTDRYMLNKNQSLCNCHKILKKR